MELATHYDDPEPRQVRQISAQHNIPDRYLEQLLATLRRCGLVRSQRGSKGGYYLGKEPEQMANSVLQKYSLKDLCEQRDARQQKDIMYYI